MPLHDDLPSEDDDDWLEHWKFDDCRVCANRLDPDTCDGCDNGEFFVEEDPDGVDDILRERSAW